MKNSFKKRQKIINDEILDEKGNYIYLEKSIKKLISNRYKNNEIKLRSSYIYQKMAVLIDKKIYLETWNYSGGYVKPSGYINVFELHENLTEIIKIYHLPVMHKNIYTEEERKYIKKYFR